MTFAEEIYPNSPLIEVVFELRFSGEMAVECRRDEFWEQIRGDYPHILVPPAGQQAPAIAGYRFENSGRKAGVMVSLNRLSHFARDYPGAKRFKREYLRLHKLFGEKYPGVTQVNRAGWRYINVIEFVREDGVVPVSRFLRLGLGHQQQDLYDRLETIHLQITTKVEDALLTLRLETAERLSDNVEALRLDIDCGIDGPLDFSDARTHIDKAHRLARQFFEDLITDQYRAFLRGDPL